MLLDKPAVPRSQAAEQSVLSAMLIDSDATLRALELVGPSDFYEPRNRVVFETLQRLHDRGVQPDAVTLADELRAVDELDKAGGMGYVAQLVDAVPSAANIESHCRIVRDRALRRAAIKTAGEVVDLARSGRIADAQGVLTEAAGWFVGLAKSADRGDFVSVSDLVKPALDEIEEARERGTHVTGLPSGFPGLDDMTGGFHPGELVIVAGRPSMGKTSFSLNVARELAIVQGRSVGVFSLEMPKLALVRRLLSAESKVPFYRLRVGQLSGPEANQLTQAAGRLKTASILIDDTSDLNTLEFRARAQRMVEQHGSVLLIVDYLQLMRVRGSGTHSRERQVAEVSRTLKCAAKDLDVAVVGLSQLSRAPERRKNPRPVLADLRESGAIEQDADLVLFPYRRKAKGDGDASTRAELIIRKQRNGPLGATQVMFRREIMSFEPTPASLHA